MKKKIITVIIIVIALILLIPIPMRLKDGGTVEYKSLLYKISDVHSLALMQDMENGKEYNEGIIIEILGFEIYNSVQ
ncbi:MAG: hypothetical protein RSD35_06930 [Oscillospiraceae bacterium]